MADQAPAQTDRPPQGYWNLVWGQFRQNRPAMISGGIILFLLWLAAWGPILASGLPWIWTVQDPGSKELVTTYPLAQWLTAPNPSLSIDHFFNYILFLTVTLPLAVVPVRWLLRRRNVPRKRRWKPLLWAAIGALVLALLPFIAPGSYESTGAAIGESLTKARDSDALWLTWALRILTLVVACTLLPFFRRSMEWSLWPAMGGAVAAFCVFLASTWLATMAVGVFYALGREAALGLLTVLAVLLILALGLLRRSKNGLFSPALLLAAPFVLLGLLAPVRLALGPWYTTSKLGAEKAPVTNDKQKAPSFPAVELPGLAKEETPTQVRYYHLFRRFRLSTTRFNTQRFELDAERGESATFTLLSQDPITPSPELLHPPFGNYRYHEGRFYREVSPDVITKPNLKGVKQVAFTGYLTGVEDDLLQLRDLPSSFGFTEQLADGTKGERQIPCGVRCPTPELREELAGKANQAVWLCGEHKPAFDKDGKLLSIHLELASVLPAPVKLPSVRHWLGTDRDGRDVLARMIHGARVSISVGFVAVGLYVLIGIFLGGLAGYYRGIVDILISRLIELMICFPTFFLILTIIAFMEERSIFHVMLVMGLTGWPGIARLVRGEFLKLAEQDFVHAARALGCSGQRVMFRHILPNALGPVLVSAAFGIAGAVLTESGLAFLGFGAPPPTPTWGEMIRQGYDHVTQGVWWLFVFPGFSIFLTVTVYNEAGDGLRDAMDPRLRK